MEFLNPAALLGLLALPLLLIPYLVRRKPRRMVFSSLLLFLEGGTRASRPLGRINLPPLFFLQLLLLALLILALSEPVFSVRPTNVALVLDNSASMQAVEDGKARFDLAKEKLGAVAGELSPSGLIDLYLTVPQLAKFNRDPWSPAQALDAVGKLGAYDLGDAPIDYDQALNQLVREQKYQRVYLFTDHPAAEQSATIRVVSIGRPRANLAVTGFEVHRSSLVDARMEASAAVANFSGRDEKIQVVLKAGDATLASREIAVPADKTSTVNFAGFAERPYYEIEIGARDALALDNRRFAVAPRSRSLRILAVTPRPQAAASLKTIQGVSVDTAAPAEYGNVVRGGHDLEIFHYSSPARLPESPALFILPPENSSLVDLGAPMSKPQISGWREPHRLTRYVNFSLLRPTYARPLRPQTAGQVILEGPGGALAFAVEQRGIRYLTLGFDPLPYLGPRQFADVDLYPQPSRLVLRERRGAGSGDRRTDSARLRRAGRLAHDSRGSRRRPQARRRLFPAHLSAGNLSAQPGRRKRPIRPQLGGYRRIGPAPHHAHRVARPGGGRRQRLDAVFLLALPRARFAAAFHA